MAPDEFEGANDRRKRSDNHWEIDKRVPLALLIFLVIQILTSVWVAAKLDSKVEAAASAIMQLESWKDAQNGTQAKTEGRLAVIEERSKDQSETLHRIDERLEKILVYKK